MQVSSPFLTRFVSALISSCYAFQTDNHDALRFPESRARRVVRKLREQALNAASFFDFSRLHRSNLAPTLVQLGHVLSQHQKFEHLYVSLADTASQDLLVALLAYRVMGRDRVRLPSNSPSYESKLRKLDELVVHGANSYIASGYDLEEFDLSHIGAHIRLRAHRMNVLHTYLLEQYCCKRNDGTLQAEDGDVVLDGGGCWGDTALFFANRVGAAGRVFSFEFLPENLQTFEKNLALNPRLRSRIEIVRRPLWNTSGEMLPYSDGGPASSLEPGGSGKARAETLSIDDFVTRTNLQRVDFIKLDIEGAEMNALIGAQDTIRRFRPKLAIAVYHRDDDLFEISAHIETLALGYKFRLDHFTIHWEESILFAYPEERLKISRDL